MTPDSTLDKTPLHSRHEALDARLVDFAGWLMPIQYAGVIEEHLAVREAAGLFDVSHMGEIVVRGPRATELLQKLTSNDVSRLADGQAQYSALTNPAGCPIDDILVYRVSAGEYLLCVNAANDDKDFAWVRDHVIPGSEAEHVSDRYAQMALQGPAAEGILSSITPLGLSGLAPFAFAKGDMAGRRCMVARTGYTGEDGFEIYCDPDDAGPVWDALLEAGRPRGLQPVGLGARDTLRLEACLALYGNDIDETTTLLEAGLGFIVKLDKGDFIGREALARQKQEGLRRRLAGFQMEGRGIARHGYPVEVDGEPAGPVRSGSYAPFVRKNVGLVYLPIDKTRPDTELDVIIRAKPVPARVVRTPFYRRQKVK